MNRRRILLDDFEDRPLAMARGRAGEQSANRLDGLTAPANDATYVPSPKLQLKDCGSAVWNFRQDHVIRKFYQLANYELEELFHGQERVITDPASHNTRHNSRIRPDVRPIRRMNSSSTGGRANWNPPRNAREVMTILRPIAAGFGLLWFPIRPAPLLSCSS